jgi:hypothetical protein
VNQGPAQYHIAFWTFAPCLLLLIFAYLAQYYVFFKGCFAVVWPGVEAAFLPFVVSLTNANLKYRYVDCER